jgi:hypothetical protein
MKLSSKYFISSFFLKVFIYLRQIETINTLDKPANSVHTDVQETEQKPDTEIEERKLLLGGKVFTDCAE